MLKLYQYQRSGKFVDYSVLAKIKRLNIIHWRFNVPFAVTFFEYLFSHIFIFISFSPDGFPHIRASRALAELKGKILYVSRAYIVTFDRDIQ
jgi:hypothetical protein